MKHVSHIVGNRLDKDLGISLSQHSWETLGGWFFYSAGFMDWWAKLDSITVHTRLKNLNASFEVKEKSPATYSRVT